MQVVVKDTTLKPLIIAQSTSCMIAAVQCSVALKVHCSYGGGGAGVAADPKRVSGSPSRSGGSIGSVCGGDSRDGCRVVAGRRRYGEGGRRDRAVGQ